MRAAHLNFHLLGFNPPLPGQMLLLCIKEDVSPLPARSPIPLLPLQGFTAHGHPQNCPTQTQLFAHHCFAGLMKFKFEILPTFVVLLG